MDGDTRLGEGGDNAAEQGGTASMRENGQGADPGDALDPPGPRLAVRAGLIGRQAVEDPVDLNGIGSGNAERAAAQFPIPAGAVKRQVDPAFGHLPQQFRQRPVGG